jgi:hypothetical protein
MASLAQMRAIFDAGGVGLVLIGMLGLEKRAPAEKTPYTIEIKRVLGSNATFTVPVDCHLESICVVNRRSSEILPYVGSDQIDVKISFKSSAQQRQRRKAALPLRFPGQSPAYEKERHYVTHSVDEMVLI